MVLEVALGVFLGGLAIWGVVSVFQKVAAWRQRRQAIRLLRQDPDLNLLIPPFWESAFLTIVVLGVLIWFYWCRYS